jgi:hypothetical protein
MLNLFSEITAGETTGEPQIGYLRGRMGLTLVNQLPNAPFRALLGAGTPLNPLSGTGGRLFAVAGSKLYELDSNGLPINGIPTYAGPRGDVGNDNNPAQLFVSGTQLGIVSDGQFWCDNGLGPVAPQLPGTTYTDISVGWQGTCTNANRNVTRVNGPPFNAGMIGLRAHIGVLTRAITNVINATQLILEGPNLTSNTTPVAFDVPASNVIVSSAQSPFGASDVGATLNFPAVSPFTGGSVTILSVDAYANATLSASPAPEGSTGGVADETFGNVLAETGAFLDSFFLVAPPNTKSVFSSAIPGQGGGLVWDPGDVQDKESYPDNVGAILADHQELLVLGESHSEVWQPAANESAFPFAPNEALTFPIGIAAPWSACSLRDGPAWIGAGLRGMPIAYFAQGFVPQRISTHAIEQVWAKYTQISDAIAFVFELEGHEFWQIGFPTADATWTYDRTASLQMGKPMWSEQNSYDGAAFHRHRANCYAFCFGRHWVGDFATSGALAGNLYNMSDQVYQDNGETILCVRTLAHFDANRLRQFFAKWQTDLETGGAAITIVLEWSDDGGTTFVGGGANFTYTTSTSTNLDRAVFWQLGSSDNRVFRLTVSGNARIALINAYLDSFVGIS